VPHRRLPSTRFVPANRPWSRPSAQLDDPSCPLCLESQALGAESSAATRRIPTGKTPPLLAMLTHVSSVGMSSQLSFLRPGIVPHCFPFASIASVGRGSIRRPPPIPAPRGAGSEAFRDHRPGSSVYPSPDRCRGEAEVPIWRGWHEVPGEAAIPHPRATRRGLASERPASVADPCPSWCSFQGAMRRGLASERPASVADPRASWRGE